MNEREERTVSDYQLERYLLREAPAPELADLDRRVAGDPVLAERVADLRRSNEELLQRYPTRWMCRRIERKLRRSRGGAPPRWSAYRLWAAPALTAVLAVAAGTALLDRGTESFLPAGDDDPTVPGRSAPSPDGGAVPVERVKGGEAEPRLMIYRKVVGGHERLEDGSLAREGDLLQIVYRSDGLAYGAIFSVDGRGAVTRHLPAAGEHAVPLAKRDTLDFAYELDDAPRWERFYLVASDRPFGLSAVREELAHGDPALPAGLRLHLFTLKKPGSP